MGQTTDESKMPHFPLIEKGLLEEEDDDAGSMVDALLLLLLLFVWTLDETPTVITASAIPVTNIKVFDFIML